MDFKIDLLTGDLDLSDGLSVVSGGRQRQQQLKLGLEINLGECFYDIDFGVPYINTGELYTEIAPAWILSDRLTNREILIKTTLDNFISSKDWVLDLESSYLFDKQNRVYTYKYTVKTQEGDEFTDEVTNGVN